MAAAFGNGFGVFGALPNEQRNDTDTNDRFDPDVYADLIIYLVRE